MPAARITVLLDEPIGFIRPELYGHFAEHLGACVDDGLWVGEASPIPNLGGLRTDVLDALKQLRIPVLRWPGGCFADDYHWEDGVGPRKDRPRRVNVWWGQTVESNAFGTHEFIEPLPPPGVPSRTWPGNVGSGSRCGRCATGSSTATSPATAPSPAAAARTGRRMPFGVRYWGVGNEAWGCGGNFCPEDYAAEYQRFATYLRDFSGTPLFLIACGPDGNNARLDPPVPRQAGRRRPAVQLPHPRPWRPLLLRHRRPVRHGVRRGPVVRTAGQGRRASKT